MDDLFDIIFWIFAIAVIIGLFVEKLSGKDEPDQRLGESDPPQTIRRGTSETHAAAVTTPRPPRAPTAPLPAPLTTDQRDEVQRKRLEMLEQPVPPDIQRDMQRFLDAGRFDGEDHSPIAYVGYKVGRTSGLPTWDRRRRLKICFKTAIPAELATKYAEWGRPASYRRYVAMSRHLRMLADMRRHRRNYEIAVTEWEQDETWFRDELSNFAERLRRSGFE